MAAAEGHSVIVELLVRVGDLVSLVLLVSVTSDSPKVSLMLLERQNIELITDQ